VVEDANVNLLLVRVGQESRARADARAHDADAVVAPVVDQPADGGARVQHGLAHGLNRATDIRADQVIGALKLGGAARLVIRQRQAQRRNAEAIEKTRQLHVALGLRVPLRKDDDRRTTFIAAALAARRRGEEVGPHGIVFRHGRLDGARPGEMLARQMIILNRGRKRVEILAMFEDSPRVLSQQFARVVSVRVLRNERCAPLEGSHDPVFIALRKMPLARAYQVSEQDISVASQKKRFGKKSGKAKKPSGDNPIGERARNQASAKAPHLRPSLGSLL
jgi:hypothetical protein